LNDAHDRIRKLGAQIKEQAATVELAKRLKYKAAFNEGLLKLKKETISNKTLFEYVKKAPHNVASNIDKLAGYLSKPVRNELEKAWVIFLWIALHISYDCEGFFAGND